MNHKFLIPAILACMVLSCDRENIDDPAAASKTISLAPRILSATGAALPRVDSVRIVVVNANSTTARPYYDSTLDWTRHADTIKGIPRNAKIRVDISGLKIQTDGSRAVWWSGTASDTLASSQILDAASLPVPVFIGDTLAPSIVYRSIDTVQNTDSIIRLVWRLREDSSFTALVNGESVAPSADSVVWTHAWVANRTLTVLATFRDKTGNLSRDSLVAIRRDRVATPLISPTGGNYHDTIHVVLSDTTLGSQTQYSLDSGITWQKYDTSLVLGSSATIRARATKPGLSTSAITAVNYSIAVATPTFSVPSGTASDDFLTVKLSSATPGAVVQFSTDSANWLTYQDSLILGNTTSIWARALKPGVTTSETIKSTYTVQAGTPAFSPLAGLYDTTQTVAISTTTSKASIHYTLDGSIPTIASPVYITPLAVGATETIQAIAIKDGLASSAIASSMYTIDTVKAPTFNPVAGNYDTAQTITLNSATGGSIIYYTTDGSTPTTTSTKYAGPITVSAGETIQAIAVVNGNSASITSSATYLIGTVGTPIFNPAAGSYAGTQSVSLTSSTVGSILYFTTDGSTPTTSSTVFSGPITVSSSGTIRAIATAPGMSNSLVASATYAIGAVGAPAFTPNAGTYSSAQTVTLASTTAGATIYYTIDGTTPTTSSTLYSGAITVASGETIRAIAVVGGTSGSAVTSATYVIGSASPPTFNPLAGIYSLTQSVSLESATVGAAIYFTTDGSAPSTSSTLYSGAITVSSGETIQAIATANGLANSTVSSATYVIGTASAPTFSVTAGAYPTAQSVSLSSPTAGATIYYTTNGSLPTSASTLYSGPIIVSSGETIQAIALATGMASSLVSSATYLIGTAGTPTFSPTAGSYPTTQSVALASTTSGAIIYYTTDGTAPTVSSTMYTGPISVSAGETINAVAITGGTSASSVSSATYLIGITSAPTFTPVAGSYTAAQSVTLASTTIGATIYFTTDGTTPTTASTRYSAPIVVSVGETIKTMAVASGTSASSVSSATYVIGSASAPTFTPAAGLYATAQTVTLSCTTVGATIYYTTNGTVPTTSSSAYNVPITVSAGETIQAIAVANGLATSTVSSSTYLIGTTSAPTFSPGAGLYSTAQTVTLSCTTVGATIYFTTNGTAPTISSTVYVGPITVSAGEMVQAIAVANGMATSALSSATYVIGTASIPTFTPSAGSYATGQSVTLASATVGATIYFTTNGTTPTTGSTIFTVPINVAAGETIQAIAVANGVGNSAVSSATYLIGTASAPTFTPAAGSYLTTQSVSLSSSTPNSQIYYTTNGTPPSTSSTVYSGLITVSSGETIQAIAVASGMANSTVSSAGYVIGTAGTPTFTPGAGSYAVAQSVVLASSIAGASIYYTTNGNVPTTASTLYSGPITVSTGETIKAIATANGVANSSVSSATYLIGTANAPSFSVPAGAYATAQSVALASTTVGATIYFTTNGTTPTTSSTAYTVPIAVTAGETIQAIAVANGMVSSNVASATYLIGSANPPTFFPVGGSYPTTQSVTLASTTVGTTLYYTINGSTPTTGSTLYGGPITVAAGETIKAIAVAGGMAASAISSATYVIGTANAPTFTPGAGSYSTTQSVTLASTTANATIYFTINGTTPTTGSTIYTVPITVSAGETIQAIAVANGMSNSFVSSATYVIGKASAPTFTPGAGAYATSQSVKLSSTTAGATIYYTTNGTAPTTGSTNYTVPITVSAGETIQAIAVANGMSNSSASSATYLIGTANAPTFTPGAGSFATSQSVTLASSTIGVTIYYTTNGSTPTTGSTVYGGPITVSAGETIQAIAVASGMSNSSVSSATYVIGTASAPTFTPGGGSYATAQSVALASSTAGATLFYTLNGATPTTSSTVYGGPITVSAGETIKAIATANGMSNSAVSSATYLIGTTNAPNFTPGGGSYASTQSVALSSTTVGANIFYTINGTTPTTGSTPYGGPITVSAGETIKAIAASGGRANSTVSSATYVIGKASAPTFTPGAGSYATTQSVTLASATVGVTVYYTTDGSLPTTSSTVYGGPITVSAGETIQAIAVASGMSNSSVSSATYVIGTAIAPTFTPGGGSYATTQSVALASGTAGATLFYTLNGATPTTSSTVYGGPITVSAGETIKAIATASGMSNSAVSSATYLIGTTNAPNFTPGGGSYASAQGVTLSSATAGANIFYTINGTTPTTASTPYGGPISVLAGETIKAIAVSGGRANSAVSSATYVIGTASSPTFTPGAGSYATAQTVTLASATAGVTIYYSTDGSTPTTASTVYASPITVSSGETIQAIAVAGGMSNSPPSSATYVIGTSGAPTFTPAAGSYSTTQSVTLASSTIGATIYFTTDGTTPTTGSTPYTVPISVSAGETIQAFAVASGTANSSVSSATYLIGTAKAPTFSVPAGSYPTAQSVTLASTTVGATIYYTTDGTVPTTGSTKFTVPIGVSAGETIQAIAVASGKANSVVSSATYVIGTASPPTFTPGAGSYATAQSVTLASATAGVIIYYTTDGTAPTTGAPIYSAPISVSAGETIQAIAVASGMSNSALSSATYVIGTASTPTFTPSAGTYSIAQSVTLASTPVGATIYYTTDGTVPTTGSAKFTVPISVSAGETIKAIAVAGGMSNSSVSSATYVIGTANAPTFTPAAGTYDTAQSVTLSSTTAGAAIYFTTDGSIPAVTPSQLYGGPITVSAGETIQAIAVAAGTANSSMSSAAYVITAAAPTFSPGAGAYPTGQTVALSTTTAGASIYYTEDGTTVPTPTSTLYAGSITLSPSGETIQAIAVANGIANSPVSSATYTITP